MKQKNDPSDLGVKIVFIVLAAVIWAFIALAFWRGINYQPESPSFNSVLSQVSPIKNSETLKTDTYILISGNTLKTAIPPVFPRVRVTAVITGFNSVVWQTDETPCIGAGGYICGRDDVIACPRKYPLGTIVSVDGKTYECLDRLHPRFDYRFDIYFGKDIQRAREWGRQKKEVIIY